jgi:hypothetical protein
MGPEQGGLAAYSNANELVSPPPFCFDPGMGDDYLQPLWACWFRESDVKSFQPVERYLPWEGLHEEWDQVPNECMVDFVQAKIVESRLIDLHPVTGVTRGTCPGNESLPPIQTALFSVSQVKGISASDFGVGRAASEGNALQKSGVSGRLIQKHFLFWDQKRWRTVLSRPQGWLRDARVGAVKRYSGAAWNPAMVALWVSDYRENHFNSANQEVRAYARAVPGKVELARIIQQHFPAWGDELRFDLD